MRNHLEATGANHPETQAGIRGCAGSGFNEELLGIEGAAASQYFQQFSGMVKVEDDLPGLEMPGKDAKQLAFNFNFTNRNRRPPTDPVNAMLSLAYSMLSKDCTLAALAVGFDPYIGFYHQPRFGRRYSGWLAYGIGLVVLPLIPIVATAWSVFWMNPKEFRTR